MYRKTSHSPCSAAPAASSPTVFFSHTAPAPVSSHQPANSIFLSHHSSHQLQLQPSEQSDYGFVLTLVLRISTKFLENPGQAGPHRLAPDPTFADDSGRTVEAAEFRPQREDTDPERRPINGSLVVSTNPPRRRRRRYVQKRMMA